MSTPYRFSITFGLQGCYMPSSHAGVYEASTRRELASIVRDTAASYDVPLYLTRGVVRQVWRNVQRYRSGSSVHFSIPHGDSVLAFHGLTDEEYERESAIDD